MINTKAIQRAISQYLDHEGETVVTLAEKLDVSHPTVVRWRSGDTRVIRSQHWAQLRYLLAPYLEDGNLAVSEPSAAYDANPAPGVVQVPVLGLSRILAGLPAGSALAGWLQGNAEGTETWPASQVAETYFCLRLGEEALPSPYPPGTLLLVAAGETPEPGDTVLARRADRPELLLARRLKKDYQALAPHSESLLPLDLLWAWPVVQARIDLRPARPRGAGQ